MDEVEAALTRDHAIVREVVHQHAPGFANHGFELTGVSMGGSPALQKFPSFHFVNKRTGMKIDISFLAAARGLNGGFNVLIIAPKNRKLDVEDYLKLHKRESLTRPFTYQDPKTDLRSFADSFLRALNALFDKELKPIVDGEVFEETPIDWMGHR